MCLTGQRFISRKSGALTAFRGSDSIRGMCDSNPTETAKAEIVVTPQMIEAGLGVVLDYDPEAYGSDVLVERIIRAALAAQQPPL